MTTRDKLFQLKDMPLNVHEITRLETELMTYEPKLLKLEQQYSRLIGLIRQTSSTTKQSELIQQRNAIQNEWQSALKVQMDTIQLLKELLYKRQTLPNMAAVTISHIAITTPS